jgi:thioredoxin reductase
MEASLALAAQPLTMVSVVARGSDHRRGKRRNIALFDALCAAGRIALHWSSEVTRIDAHSLCLSSGETTLTLDYDAVFVLIGGSDGSALLPQSGSCG